MGDRPLIVSGREVARHVYEPELEPFVSPRPYLHPVRTLGGVGVTDAAPVDHRWHLGCNVGIQDVNGTNFWGGRTYRREDGYQDRDDRGHVRHRAFLSDDPLTSVHDWVARDGRVVLTEDRTLRATAANDHWQLDFSFTLQALTDPVILGSPGTNGRANAGYGGFFWRLPASAAPVNVFGPLRSDESVGVVHGEEGVHGRVAPWVAVGGDSGAPSQAYTLVFLPGDAATAADPWFVRVAAYPGVGSALAYTDPVHLAPGDTLTRRVRILITDGRRPADEISALAAAAEGWGGTG
ncbi:PmoA family protein [Cryptosporangium sp. NPDC048952]|uniref:DUF6807 domain-containing protein n=1 Tax=Cryptosporangium sp. NPDC048952 TaxID=3363961 RepID=UPI00371DEB82